MQVGNGKMTGTAPMSLHKSASSGGGRGGLTAASTLMVEEKLQEMLTGEKPSKTLKRMGLLPKSQDSVFGDFFPEGFGKQKSGAGHLGLMSSQGFRKRAEKGLAAQREEARKSEKGHKMSKAESAAALWGIKGVGAESSGKGNAAGRRRKIEPTQFRAFYTRGDLPIQVKHGAQNSLTWKVDLDKLDYHHYLPAFLDGIREKEEPYRFMAVQGSYDLLGIGNSAPANANAAPGQLSPQQAKILSCVPQLIMPMKQALDTRDPEIVCVTLKIIQLLCKSCGPRVGEALVPYYRQLLPVCNIFKGENKNLGDRIDYAQRKSLCMGDLISETLNVLEQYGGEDAFINIKYMVPTYESCVLS